MSKNTKKRKLLLLFIKQYVAETFFCNLAISYKKCSIKISKNKILVKRVIINKEIVKVICTKISFSKDHSTKSSMIL